MTRRISYSRLRKEVEAIERVGTKDDRPAGVCNGVCIVFTGYRTHADSDGYRKLQKELKGHGFWVRTVELPNHGRPVDGHHGIIDDFRKVPQIVRASIILLRRELLYHDEPVFLIGHSTGVLGIMLALNSWPKLQHLIRGVVVFGSPFKLELNASKYLRFLGPIAEILRPVLRLVLRRIKYLRQRPVDTPTLAPGSRALIGEKKKKDPFYYDGGLELGTMLEIQHASVYIFPRIQQALLKVHSLLAIHGMEDPYTSEKYAREAYQNVVAPDTTYLSLEKVGHEFNSAVVTVMSNWLDERVGSTKC